MVIAKGRSSQRPTTGIYCMRDGAFKRSLAANRRVAHVFRAVFIAIWAPGQGLLKYA